MLSNLCIHSSNSFFKKCLRWIFTCRMECLQHMQLPNAVHKVLLKCEGCVEPCLPLSSSTAFPLLRASNIISPNVRSSASNSTETQKKRKTRFYSTLLTICIKLSTPVSLFEASCNHTAKNAYVKTEPIGCVQTASTGLPTPECRADCIRLYLHH